MGDLGIGCEVYYPAEVVVDAFGRVLLRPPTSTGSVRRL